jgi:hypothetical protein
MTAFILGVTAFTSLGAFLIGGWLFGWPAGVLRTAVARMLECVGATLVFALLNFVVAIALIFGARVLGGRFVSSYYLDDVSWFALASLQGLTWCFWRIGARR